MVDLNPIKGGHLLEKCNDYRKGSLEHSLGE